MTKNIEPEVMTPKEAAVYLNTTEGTLRWYRSAGIGPVYTKPSGRVFYHKRDLDEYLARGRQVPAVRAAFGT